MTIVAFSELTTLRRRVAMVDGGFDPIHHGHVAYFKAAAQLGLPLLCCLASDRYVGLKHKPLLSQQSRAAVIDAIRYIDYVCINDATTAEVLEALQPHYYVKGKDWENRLPPAETAVCAAQGIKIVYLDTMLDSSSRILKDYLTPEG
jgi:cytidyltransferase-like protein